MGQDFCCGEEVIHEEAVSRAKAAMRDRASYEELAGLFKNFGDTTRAGILHALEAEELCVCDLAALFGITKSAVSHQLKILRLANLVKSRRDGQIIWYSLADDHVKAVIDLGFEHLDE